MTSHRPASGATTAVDGLWHSSMSAQWRHGPERSECTVLEQKKKAVGSRDRRDTRIVFENRSTSAQIRADWCGRDARVVDGAGRPRAVSAQQQPQEPVRCV